MITMWLHLSREKGKRPLDLFSSGFFLLEEYIKNSENDVDQREQSCQRQSACTSVLEVSITGVQAVRCLLVLAKKQFRECGKTNAYSANIEFNVSAHGEHIRERKAPTENSNIIMASCHLVPLSLQDCLLTFAGLSDNDSASRPAAKSMILCSHCCGGSCWAKGTWCTSTVSVDSRARLVFAPPHSFLYA